MSDRKWTKSTLYRIYRDDWSQEFWVYPDRDGHWRIRAAFLDDDMVEVWPEAFGNSGLAIDFVNAEIAKWEGKK